MPWRHPRWSRKKETRCVPSYLPMERRLPSNPIAWAFGTYGPAVWGATIATKSPLYTERQGVLGGLPMVAVSFSRFIPGSAAKFTLPKSPADSLIWCKPLRTLTISHQAGPVMESGSTLPRREVRNLSRFGKCPLRVVRQPELQRTAESRRSNLQTANSFITASTNKAAFGECLCRAAKKRKSCEMSKVVAGPIGESLQMESTT